MRAGIGRALPVPVGLFRAMLLILLGVGAMYGASIGLTCGGHEAAGQVAVNLPDAVMGAAARAGVATRGGVAAIGAATPIVALLSGADDGQHPDWMTGCVLALTAILTVALGRSISGRHGDGLLRSPARWSQSSTFRAIAWSGSAQLVPFSMCVLRR